MPWKEPGKGNKDPWSSGEQPPDLEEVFRNLSNRLKSIFGGGSGGRRSESGNGGGSGGVFGILVIAILLWIGWDTVHIVDQAERGVVLRFGKYVDTLQPGPSIRLPRPIEQVFRVDIDKIRTVEVGYRSEGKQQMTVLNESSMLTQDENIVDVKLAVQYRVKSPADFLFHDRDPTVTMRDATESAIREVVGKSKMDFVLREGRAEVAARTKDLLQTILDRYNNGLLVTSVNLQDAQPPEQVQEAFFDAIRAREDQDRLINEAEAYSNEVIPKARGGAARITEDANAYKAKIIATAEGDASRFTQIMQQYNKAPEVTRERMYLETVENVLGKTPKVLIDVEKGSNLLYLPLDKLMQRSTSEPSTPNMSPSSSSPTRSTSQEDRQQQSSSNTRQPRTREVR